MPQARRPQRATYKDDIVDAFAKLAAENGYARTSLEEVAKVVKGSKGALIHHFGTKERLLAEVHLRFMSRRLAEAHHIKRELDDPLSQLVALIHALIALHEDEHAAGRVFMREFALATNAPEMQDVRTARDEYVSIVRGVIARGMADGLFVDQDPELVTLQVFGMCNHMWTWYRPGGLSSVEDISRVFVTVLLAGLQAEPDRDALERLLEQAFRVRAAAKLAAAG